MAALDIVLSGRLALGFQYD